MRGRFRCVCCGKRVNKYEFENLAHAGYLCTICSAAYHMGMEDAVRTKIDDVGRSLTQKVEMMEKRIGSCEASGIEVKSMIYDLGSRVTNLEKKVE